MKPKTHRTLLLAVTFAVLVSLPACSRKPLLEPGGRTGVKGTVRIGPSCPVERQDSPCPDRPLRATIQVRDPSGHVVTTFISNEDGSFQVDLAPGRYTLVPQASGKIAHAEPVDVVVREGTYTRVEISYDSGIR